MGSLQPKQFFQAVKSGDVAKVREHLAAGLPIDATDVNRKTPVMLAAQAGQLEIFRLLADHGADLQTLALNQTDVLECAAEGGNVEIVQFLIERGHPVDGHWQPRSKVSERAGHMTPLIMAAINGRVDVVRLLLESGANRKAKFDGQSAFDLIEEDINHPLDADAFGKVPQLKQIAALLTDSAAAPSPHAHITAAFANLAENAHRPEYKQLRTTLAHRCGDGQPWRSLPDHGLPAADVLRFTFAGCEHQQTLDDLQADARAARCHLVLEELWTPGEAAALVLFPTDNKLAVVASVGTEGVNHGVQTSHIIEWLEELEGKNPFHLVCCSHDLVGGTFPRAVKNAKQLAARIAEVCPGCLSEGFETLDALAVQLKKQRTFLLRWD